MSFKFVTSSHTSFGAVALASVLLLASCDETGQFAFPTAGTQADTTAEAPSQSVELIERDVEAPEVFQVTESGLWDGRPSLGGVWVAHPDVTDPERVIIRNQSNGKFVIGALFRRERENPGPLLQVSSDAANALGMLAGAPASLNVTALRREEVTQPTTEATTYFDEVAEIETTTLDPIAGAAAAIDAAEAQAGVVTPSLPSEVTPPVAGPLTKPYIQLGIFSVQANATRVADVMRANGIVPTVLEQSSQGRAFWRVLVGPAASVDERAALLGKVKAQGYSDAYFVTN